MVGVFAKYILLLDHRKGRKRKKNEKTTTRERGGRHTLLLGYAFSLEDVTKRGMFTTMTPSVQAESLARRVSLRAWPSLVKPAIPSWSWKRSGTGGTTKT
jgi:hypothetical protein